jgi:hypothetical protein
MLGAYDTQLCKLDMYQPTHSLVICIVLCEYMYAHVHATTQ